MFQYLNWRSIEIGFGRLKFIDYHSLVSFVDLTPILHLKPTVVDIEKMPAIDNNFF